MSERCAVCLNLVSADCMGHTVETVLAKEVQDGAFSTYQDVLPHYGRVHQRLNDSGILTFECDMGWIVKDMNENMERYTRVT